VFHQQHQTNANNFKEKRETRTRHLALIAGLVLVGIALLAFFVWRDLALTGGRLGVPLDDAWIHFQFARNISAGRGFSFNPGVPTPGSTAPLWTLFLAAIGLFTTDFLLLALLLSAGCFLLTGVMAALFTRELSENWLCHI